ncbi:MAG: hypothetical protein K6G09_00460, partial [Treponema sp.]|nr:hypothetical protein [Treponema sp.]
ANIKKRNYLMSCFRDIVKYFQNVKVNWYYINKLTKDGYPPHPLYQKTALLKELSIETLLKQ